MTNQASIHALIPAAGLSQRFGSETLKQYVALLGQPVLARSIEALNSHPMVQDVTVVVAAEDRYFDRLVRPAFPGVGVVTGGPSRAHSVLNGLRHILGQHDAADMVLVHDAARPCIARAELDDLIGAGLDCEDGAILAIPVSDTIKRGNSDNRIETTVDRNNLWQAQTPQMFPAGQLVGALEAALSGNEPPTDEASAMEFLGARPRLVRGSSSNIKITTPQDLIIAEGIMRQRQSAAGGSED